ncbi:rho guanine nucleotide exchange factor 40-like isoform X2 [Nelusetta ayraudi]|uniref:rho guanine nucleotide exchange factor 40-like isoform X2 n=1 Tax=Nelusetta ayraudi TaxID=303726 RepID=UPI003F71078E
MDPDSLEHCIHTTLSALYPPCQSTSSTLRRQVLCVAERCYRGDALRCIFHFLLPAKRLLAELQRDARALHCNWAFTGDSWPLCIHEKVAVQLCHPDQRHLRPGDFYLLVSPPAVAGPRLLLCSVSPGSDGGGCSHVEQQEVAAAAVAAPGSLFTMSWLDSVNRERERRGASRLERCLLSLHADVFRVPWEDLVYPQLAGRPRPTPPSGAEGDEPSTRATRRPGSASSVTGTDQSRAASESEDSEGEYVELAELPRFSPQRGSLTQSISLQRKDRTATYTGFSSSFGPQPRAPPAFHRPFPTLSPPTPAEPRGRSRTPEQQSGEGGDARG